MFNKQLPRNACCTENVTILKWRIQAAAANRSHDGRIQAADPARPDGLLPRIG